MVRPRIAHVFACAVLLLGLAFPVFADEPIVPDGGAASTTVEAEFAKRIKANEDISPLGADLLGDSVSLYNGTLSFATTDVSLPGIGLPVSVGRRYAVGGQSTGGHFGDWELDIPHLSATYSTRDGWIVTDPNSPDRLKRCNQFDAPPGVVGSTLNGGVFTASEFWHGVNLVAQGGSQEILLRYASTPWQPTDGQSYPLVTTGRWLLRCLNATASGEPGEAFVAVAPDGTQYRFDWLVRRNAPLVTKGYAEPNPISPESPRAPVPGSYSLQRYEYWMLPTLITDRYGNTVQYTYDTAAGADRWRLLSIVASDGRTLTLTYDGTSHRIRTVSAGARTWTYTYTAGELTDVKLPDNTRWTFALTSLTYANINYASNSVSCSDVGAGSYTAGTFVGGTSRSGTITHPSGATGTFVVEPRHHGRAFMPARANNCIVYNLPGGGQRGFERDPEVFDTWALTSKTLTGPGLSSLQWTYGYSAAQNNAIGDACAANCPRTKTVTVTDPEGHTNRHTFGTKYRDDEGRLISVDVGWNGASALRTTTYRHRASDAGPYPPDIGQSFRESGDTYMATRLFPQDRRRVTERDTTFTWEATAFDDYGEPTTVTRSSTLGPSRTEATVYHHNTTKWILHQIASVTETGTGAVMRLNTYNPITATQTTAQQFDQPVTTLAYYADGTLFTQTDGANHTTTFSDYHRGIARSVTLTDNRTITATVNDYGEITALKNPANFTTRYDYDAVGRLKRIDYPDGDVPESNDTTLTFAPVGVFEYDVAPGHWKQTVTTGSALTERIFDALWRPVMTHVVDTGNVNGTQRMTRRAFDSDGRETYASYPARSLTSVITVPVPAGVTTAYDALGRVSGTSANWEDSNSTLTTSVEWLDGFTRRTTNARGKITTTTFQAFDEPDDSAPLTISAPETALTTITRDVFGKPLTLTRSGLYQGNAVSATRRYVYDPQQRLCKTIEPESGATVKAYNTANLVAWKATGQSLASTASCEQGSVAANQKATYTYDNVNRLTATTYADGGVTQPVTRTYTPDGLLERIESDNSVWTTTYNRRRLPVNETLTLAGVNYPIGYTYTANGHAAGITYPDGTSISYAPNALGEATQVGNYATQVTTHPNGALAGFRYGNNILHTTQQNTRGLPSNSTDAGIVNDTYAYDENANVTSITDALTGTFTRTMTYDDLDRLATANSPQAWDGMHSFSYDPLDNLRTTVAPKLNWTHQYNTTTQRLTRIASGATDVIAYTYDARGRVTTRNNQTFTIDLADRVKQISGKNPTTYRYDGHGRRTTVTKAETTTVQVYSQAGQLLYQSAPTSDGIFKNGFQPGDTNYGSGGGTKRYVYLGRHLIAEDGSAGRKYLHTDGLGSPVRSTDANGTPSARENYLPYGWGATPQSTPGFTGHVTDAETGLSYMQARYYDPFAGRFLAVDPVEADAGSFNRYWYANDNPYKNIDPDGRLALDPLATKALAAALDIEIARSIRTAATAVEIAIVADELTPEPTDAALPKHVVYAVVFVGAMVVGDYVGDVLSAHAAEPANYQQPVTTQSNPIVSYKVHTSGARPSTRGKHEEGQARRDRDRGGEKGDVSRRPPSKRPPGWKGSWPPKPPTDDPPKKPKENDKN